MLQEGGSAGTAAFVQHTNQIFYPCILRTSYSFGTELQTYYFFINVGGQLRHEANSADDSLIRFFSDFCITMFCTYCVRLNKTRRAQ